MRLDVRLATPGLVRVKVYNLAAELVRSLLDGSYGNGTVTAVWDGKNERGDYVSSGLYYVVYDAPGSKEVRLVGVVK